MTLTDICLELLDKYHWSVWRELRLTHKYEPDPDTNPGDEWKELDAEIEKYRTLIATLTPETP